MLPPAPCSPAKGSESCETGCEITGGDDTAPVAAVAAMGAGIVDVGANESPANASLCGGAAATACCTGMPMGPAVEGGALVEIALAGSVGVFREKLARMAPKLNREGSLDELPEGVIIAAHGASEEGGLVSLLEPAQEEAGGLTKEAPEGAALLPMLLLPPPPSDTLGSIATLPP